MATPNPPYDQELLDSFRVQTDACIALGSPLTAGLVEQLAQDYQAQGPVYTLLKDWPGAPMADALALRVCGALHGAALTKRDETLTELYQTAAEGKLEMPRFWQATLRFLNRDRAWVRDYLQFAPQTNEARRSILLLTGFLYLADQFDMDMHMLELGASAGLNMNWDMFHYDLETWKWGPPSPVTLSTRWTGPPPPVSAPLRIASRAGCDLNPLNLDDTAERTRLRSYCWRDVPGRMARLDGAIQIARKAGTKPDKAGAADWLAHKLANRPERGLTIVYHSIFLQYPPKEERTRIYNLMKTFGQAATPNAPLAWVRFEPGALLGGGLDVLEPVLDIQSWPGGNSRTLARSDGHVTYAEAFSE